MAGDESGPKLTAEQRYEIIPLIAEGYNAQRICDYLEYNYNIAITRQTIHRNYIRGKKWQKRILEIRANIDKDLAKHPLAQKVHRLNIIQEAINEAFTWRVDKIYYSKNGKELSRIMKRNIGTVAQLVAEARKEVEGDKPLVDQSKHVHHKFVIEQLHDLAKEHKREQTERQSDGSPTGSEGSEHRDGLFVVK